MDKKREYWNSISSQKRRLIARRAGTTYDYLYQICASQKTASPALARKIEKATKGELTTQLLLPPACSRCGRPFE